MQGAEVEPPRVEIEARPLVDRGGKAIQKRVERDVGIGLGLGLVGGAGQVRASCSRQKLAKDALAQEYAGGVPFLVTAAHQVFIGAAVPARRENKIMRQALVLLLVPSLNRAQLRPIEVAKDRFVGVGSLTARTDKDHDLQ